MDKNIWVVDDDESIRWVLEKGLVDSGMKVETFDSANKVIKKLETENPKLILTDIRMPGPSGIDLLDKVKELRPEIPVIIMTAHSDLESAVESYEHGAWEYLPKPFDIDEAVLMVQRATKIDEQIMTFDVWIVTLQGRREDFKAYSLEVHHKVKASLS